jgi:predicted outer membrane repeat protein
MMQFGNRRRVRPAVLACAIASSIGLLSGCSENPTGPDGGPPVTIVVDATGGGDYLTIGAAINASSEGDTVLVMPGVYSGEGNRDLDFEGINITLRASSARDSAVIDCEDEGRAFRFHSGENEESIVEGFIIKNGSAAKGGAIRCDGASPTIRDVTFRMNEATQDGGAIYLNESSAALSDVSFFYNAATQGSGGAIFCLSSAPSIESIACTGNNAGSGGAISCIFSSPAIQHAAFVDNFASSAGGALYAAGSDERRADPTVTSATLIANTAYRGAGMSLSSASPSLSRVSFARNSAVFGGGIFCENGCAPSIANTIIAFSSGGAALVCSPGDNPSTTRSCIFGNAGGDDLCGTYTENLFADPLFCDMNENDVSLCENSPCLPANNVWGAHIGAVGEGCGECEESR